VPHSGDAVQLLNREAAEPLLSQFMSESALHDVDRAPIRVEVETNDPIMYRQVADNLLWYGFEPSPRLRQGLDPEQTTISYSGSSAKGAFAGRLAAIFRQDVNDIILIENGETRSAGYHIDLGRRHNPCLPYLELDH
jgi:hypothetical protein